MPRTTVDLDEQLIEVLKQRAAAGRESMSRLVARLVRDGLVRLANDTPQPFHWHVMKSRPAPGFDPATRDYLDILDEDRA